ncbi:MAG: hypothetical protein P8J61_05060 [Gammaproteobacteria bacterium]|jgi:hypothetical protein|nr:hypothetical protein [Gammaproteobacteria bacterium]
MAMQKHKNDIGWNDFLAQTTPSKWNSGLVEIAGERIVPHFQPIVGIISGKIVGLNV